VSDLMLALDTSTSAITVALLAGDEVRAERAVLDPRRHSEVLAPAIDTVLREADSSLSEVSRIAVGVGPGPFTGLRVGVVTATTLGFALGVPVHGVCSLDALAQEYAAQAAGEFVVATDARRKEVYWARYRAESDVAQRISGPEVSRPADLPAEVVTLPVAGRGPLLYPDVFARPAMPLDASGGSLGRVARRLLAAGEVLPVIPMYLRRPDVQEPGKPKSTLLPRDS